MNPLDRLTDLPQGPGLQPLLQFVRSFEEPRDVASEILDLLERSREDEYVAPPEDFTERPRQRLFEEWDYPVNAFTLFEVDEGRLLCLPPGSDRFSDYRDLMPRIIDRHLERNFPRLKSELANRPNLFYPGVYYPDEITIDNMEMISLHHGRNYVVRAELSLEDRSCPVTVALKPTCMGVEAIVTSLLDELNRRMPVPLRNTVGPVRVPEIVSVDEHYGILEYLPGANGVEVLPRGIQTGTLRTLRSNEYPEDFSISPEGLLNLADEFAKQAVLAFYLRLYDRKPDQFIFNPRDEGQYDVAHIDFGRSVKKNFALPWQRYYATQKAPLVFEDHQIPYFEAATSLIFLPHFIPRSLREDYPPFDGMLRDRVRDSFVQFARYLRNNAGVIHDYLQYLVGNLTQFDQNEVFNRRISREDVEEVRHGLLALEPAPESVINSVLSLARRERNGRTPSHIAANGENESVYHRGVRSGDPPRKIENAAESEPAYTLYDYNQGNRVFYDPDRQTLELTFGRRPEAMIQHLQRRVSPTLARQLKSFPRLIPEATVRIHLDGRATVRLPSGWIRRDVSFPPDVIQQVRQSVSGFAPPHHVENYVAHYRDWIEDHPEVDFTDRAVKRQSLIFTNNLEGKEVLQCYLEIEDDENPLHKALSEVVYHLLSNPEYLADKDPWKSINDLIVHLGHKHDFVEPLGKSDVPQDCRLGPLYGSMFEVYNRRLQRAPFPDSPSPALLHVRCMLRLGELFADSLKPSDRSLFRAGVLLHDLYLLESDMVRLIMDPNGRSRRPVLRGTLTEHPERSRREWERLLDGTVTLPDHLSSDQLVDLMTHHHPSRWKEAHTGGAPDYLRELLHVTERLVDYSDKSRPSHWNQGSLRLNELAPTWIRTQLDRHDFNDRTRSLLSEILEGSRADSLSEIDGVTDTFQGLANALQMAAPLHYGLDPRNPDLLNELRSRHGRATVDGIWERVIESNLPVGEKVRLVRRIDDLAPLFGRLGDRDYAFVNASPRPIQHAEKVIDEHLSADRIVILVGFFPRVTKAFRRFHTNRLRENEHTLSDVVAISGPRRLQFIRHSYPYEADFERPFHETIQSYRHAHTIDETFCFVPFVEFYRSYDPSEKAASRIRNLEKASDLEEHHPPERVKHEAVRYREWKRDQSTSAVDTLENERMRRILLNDFSNREILYYYRETLPDRPDVREALKEVIGAVHENPNYLSERNSRYSLHELVRSLSQIHFFPEHRKDPKERLRDFLNRPSIDDPAPYTRLFDRMGSEFNFLKHTFVSALEILQRMPRSGDTSWPVLILSTLCGTLLCDDEAVRDYLLSPEDVSYHRSLRRRLIDYPTDLLERFQDSSLYGSLPETLRQDVVELLGNQRPMRDYAAVQFALFLAFYGDYSRVENWERGRYRLDSQDLGAVLPHFFSSFDRLVDEPPRSLMRTLRSWVTDSAIVEHLNSLAFPTHSYVYLFNALSLSSDLRYGLFPRGLNTFENTRRLYGPDRVNRIVSGIVRSRISVVQAVKIARKVRYIASALQRFDRESTAALRFAGLDRPGGADVDLPPRRPNRERTVILTGSCEHVLAQWEQIRSPKSRSPDLYCLVGEEFPLFIKDTTLACTDTFRRRIRNYRTRNEVEGRHRLLPAEVLFEDLNGPMKSFFDQPEGNSRPPDPACLFLRAYLRLFEPSPA